MEELKEFVKAGLLQREVAEIVGVSRVTVNRWFKDHTKPHPLINRRLQEVVEQVRHARIYGKLPLDTSLARDDRLGQLKEILNDE